MHTEKNDKIERSINALIYDRTKCARVADRLAQVIYSEHECELLADYGLVTFQSVLNFIPSTHVIQARQALTLAVKRGQVEVFEYRVDSTTPQPISPTAIREIVFERSVTLGDAIYHHAVGELYFPLPADKHRARLDDMKDKLLKSLSCRSLYTDPNRIPANASYNDADGSDKRTPECFSDVAGNEKLTKSLKSNLIARFDLDNEELDEIAIDMGQNSFESLSSSSDAKALEALFCVVAERALRYRPYPDVVWLTDLREALKAVLQEVDILPDPNPPNAPNEERAGIKPATERRTKGARAREYGFLIAGAVLGRHGVTEISKGDGIQSALAEIVRTIAERDTQAKFGEKSFDRHAKSICEEMWGSKLFKIIEEVSSQSENAEKLKP